VNVCFRPVADILARLRLDLALRTASESVLQVGPTGEASGDSGSQVVVLVDVDYSLHLVKS